MAIEKEKPGFVKNRVLFLAINKGSTHSGIDVNPRSRAGSDEFNCKDA